MASLAGTNFRPAGDGRQNYERAQSGSGADRPAAARDLRRMNAAVSCIAIRLFSGMYLASGSQSGDLAKKHGDDYRRGRQGWQQIFGICIRRLAEAAAVA